MTINVTKSAVTLFNNEAEECNLPSDWLNQSKLFVSVADGQVCPICQERILVTGRSIL